MKSMPELMESLDEAEREVEEDRHLRETSFEKLCVHGLESSILQA